MTEEIFEKFGDEPSIEDAIALKTQNNAKMHKSAIPAILK